ncbi:galactose mutarotase [Deinococcus sp. HMF7604]|uniref:aldose epimerase family protein n=1 Tax=Deinococcus betulae TaxID=2873312 RepID=UPI001CC9366B|nr:aldose epimerase family protein [Deinococcus betulae]MBZ9750068.1 galactose mutarotase [Deinococcus betulae]
MSAAGTLDTRRWGVAPGGQEVCLYTLSLPGGAQVTLTNFGATLVGVQVPDREGVLGDVVLGHEQPEGYFSHDTSPYLGATVGRYANRIAGGRFVLDGRVVELPLNDGPHTLHGGPRGFDLRLWQARPVLTPQGPQVTFSRLSPHGEEGFPGTMRVWVTYSLTADPHPTLALTYRAETDAPTVVNLTNHTYWNLSAAPRSLVLDHDLTLHADHYTPALAGGIPTGEVRAVGDTPLDFRAGQRLGEAMARHAAELPGGYDHNVVVRGPAGTLRPAAVLRHPASGRELTVATTAPGLQVYTGNFLDGAVTGKGGQVHARHAAVCLETQHFPDSPNQPDFPSTRLNPGEVYESQTTFTFRTR